LGITPQADHKWMRGGSEITLTNLRTLAKILNVNWLWLRYGQNVVMELATPSQTVSPVEQYRQRLIGEMIEGERRRRWVLETLGIGLSEIDVLPEVRYWGPNFRKILHIPIGMEATQENMYAAMTEESAVIIHTITKEALETGERRYGNAIMMVNPNEVIEFMIAPIKDAEGMVVRLMGMVRRVDKEKPSLREFIDGCEEGQ